MHAAKASKCRKFTLLAAVVATFALPAPASAAVRILAENTLENAVVYRINTIRASRGLHKLTTRTALKTAGTKHATNMARHGYFSHSWSTGTTFGTWIGWFWPGPGYSSWTAGENLYWRERDATARQVVRAWMASPPHRANILRGTWRSVGIGAVNAANAFGAYRGTSRVAIVAAEFGRRS